MGIGRFVLLGMGVLAGLDQLAPAPTDPPQGGGETYLLQIEDFAGPWRTQTNIRGYLGRGFKTSNAEGVATVGMIGRVRIGHGGRYAVWVRGYEGEGWDRSFSLSVGRQRLPPTHTRRDAQGFNWQYAGSLFLEPGEVEIIVHDEGDSFEVADALLLTSDPDGNPAREEQARQVLADSSVENRRLVDVIIQATVESAERAHRGWAEAMTDLNRWQQARQELRRRFLATVGLDPLPERTALNARILGATRKDGYRVERLLFESRPGFPVTANVYVPETTVGKSPVRYPAVLCPSGHWQYAKAQEQVQARCAGLAKLGFLALTYDPFGQGERAVPGNEHQTYFGALLAGYNNMSFMLWDTIRALDYLLTRDDVDPDRIACTGASGGGLNTLYAAAIDERIQVAVPVVYASSLREFLGTRIDHCPCSHLPGLAGYADMGDVAALIAPRPMLLITARQDLSFTVKGAWDVYHQALPAYQVMGAHGNLHVYEVDSDHDYNRTMREAMYGFMLQHLKGVGEGAPVPEPTLNLEPPDSPVLRCFETGRVPDTAPTVRSLARQRAEQLIAHLPTPSEMTRSALREILGWPEGPIAGAQVEQLWLVEKGEREKALLRAPDGVALPIRLLRSPQARATAILLDEAGGAAALDTEMAQVLRMAGCHLVTVDLRGWGETSGREHLLVTDSLLGGRPLLGQRAQDLLAIAAYLRARDDLSGPWLLVARGPAATLVALIATALGDAFTGVAVAAAPESLLDFYDHPQPVDAVAWRLLEVADRPHLQALAHCPVQRLEEGEYPLADWLREVIRLSDRQ